MSGTELRNEALGKRLNVGSDFHEGGRIGEDVLKKLASGDGVFLDRKGVEPLDNVRLTAKLLFPTNGLPHFSDRSDGLWRRLVILPFTVRIAESDRVPGLDSVGAWAAEAPGLLNWALQGRKRLLTNGRFTVPQSCREAVERHRVECDPVALFVAECVAYHDDAYVSKREAFDQFKCWSENSRQGTRLSQVEFGKRFIRAAKCQEGRPGARGSRTTAYLGVNLKEPAPVS
jgi:putative DNA primase/helicase